MSWYIHPSKQLREGELPPELVVTNGDGSVQQVYVPHRTCYNASYRLDESRFHCSECGFGCWVKDVADGRDKLPHFCPSCGAKVVDA